MLDLKLHAGAATVKHSVFLSLEIFKPEWDYHVLRDEIGMPFLEVEKLTEYTSPFDRFQRSDSHQIRILGAREGGLIDDDSKTGNLFTMPLIRTLEVKKT